MVSWFVFMVWVGGMYPVYVKHRGLGRGRIASWFDAFVWPGGLGHYISRRFYSEW